MGGAGPNEVSVYRRAWVAEEQRVECGPRFSWLAIAMVFGPIVLLAHDVARRYAEVQQRVEYVRSTRIVREPYVPRPLPKCVCTGMGDPLCSEIPNQTCMP